MLKNYLIITLRTLRRHPGYAAINVLGLSVGLASCLLLLLYVQDEQSYDTFHTNADRLYRVVRERQVSENEWGRQAATAWRVAPMLQATFPQIERYARISPQETLVQRGETRHVEERFYLADSTFFDLFTFPLVAGDAATALRQPFSVVLTETSALKFFGDVNPLGQTLTAFDRDFTVTGIARDVPEHAHFHFDFVASMQSAEAMWSDNRERFESMGAIWLYTYLLLQPGTDVPALQTAIDTFTNETVARMGINMQFRMPLQRVTDIHLHSDYDGEIEANGDATALYALVIIAAFVLLIACINFTNLASARAAWRMKEVGVRKAVGAQRSHLIGQFLSEAVVLSLAALGLGAGLVVAALPAFNAFTEKTLTLAPDTHGPLLAAFAGLTVLVGLAAGSYPAFYLSAFRPVSVLKSQQTGGPRGAARLRHGLVVFQFAITIVLFISTAVVYQQLQYAQSIKLGFDRENVVVVRLNNVDARAHYEQLRDAIAQLPGVASVSAASNTPPDGLNTWGIEWDGAMEGIDRSIRVMAVDERYLETLGLDLAAGRNFSADRPTDATSAFLINETAAEQFGFAEPIGQQVRFPVNNRIVKEGEIIGVVQDFHLASLHEMIQPVMLTVRPEWYGKLLVRTRPDTVPETLVQMEAQWKQVSPAWPFEYTFLDERLDQLYRPEQRTGTLFRTFSLLAIFVACLGLLGLAAFTAEKRTKEIGVRKVLGASVSRVVVLLTKNFLWLVVLAFGIAAPVAYFLMDRWLQDFAYRVELSWPLFVLAGLLALLIAALTVSYQAVKAARTDPVRTLRYE